MDVITYKTKLNPSQFLLKYALYFTECRIPDV